MNRISLKNIRHAAGLSHETEAFTASLYLDGKPIGIVENAGHGGCNSYYPRPGKPEDMARIREAEEYAKTISEWSFEQLDGVVSDLLGDHLVEKELKTKLKRKVLFVQDGKPGIRTITRRQSCSMEKALDYIRRVHPNWKLLQDMPFDEALALWKATA